MATHANNSLRVVLITSSVVNVDVDNNTTLGEAEVRTLLPVEHDLSSQIDGETTEFMLHPAIGEGTEQFVEVYLDGQRLTRSFVEGGSDFYLNTNRIRLVLAPDFLLNQNSTLIIKYIESAQI